MPSPITPIVNTQLPATTGVLLYTSPTGTWTQILKVLCVNTDSSVHAVTLYLVPSGGSIGTPFITTDAQAVLPAQSFNSPNEYGLVLGPGDKLFGFADTASVVNLFVSGLLATS